MAIDQWRWPISAGQTVNVNDRSRSNRFGDGTQQTALEGINPFIISMPVMWTGQVKTGKQIVDFLKAHITDPFKMVPPAGVLGLYTVKTGTIKYQVISNNVMTVSFEVEQSVGIYKGAIA